MPATRRSFSNVFSSLVRVLKAADSDALNDLADSLDLAPEPADVGNAPHRTPGAAELGIGRPQRMDGAGAERMSAEFSDPQRGNGITEQYDELSRRLGGLESMTKALAGLVLAIGKASGTLDDDIEEPEEDEKKDETAKAAGLPMLNLAGFFNSLTPRSPSANTGRPGLASPPDMNVLAKSSSFDERFWTADLTGAEQIVALEIQQLAGAVSLGAVPVDTYKYRLGAAPAAVRDLFGA